MNYNYDLGGYEQYFNDPAVQSAASGAITGAIIAVVIFAIIASIIGIVLYVFESLAFYKIAKNRNIPNPWMAWIPFCSGYLIGKIGDYYDLKLTGKSHNFAIWILCLLIGGAVAPLTVILAFLSPCAIIAALVLEYICIYKFLKNVNPENSVVMLVLGIIFSVAMPFILFSQRNKLDLAPAQPMYQQPVYNGYQQPVQPQYQQPVQPQYQQPVQPQYQQPVQPQYQQPAQPQYQQPQAPVQPQTPVEPQAPVDEDNTQQ